MAKPEKTFRCGAISASIWSESKMIDNRDVLLYSIKIDKAYKTDEGWKHTNNFMPEDLPKVAVVANEAYKYIRLSQDDAGSQ